MLTMTRMTVGELRNIITEAMALAREPEEQGQPERWMVMADAISSMGFNTRRKDGNVVGYATKGIWAPFQALKDMDAKNLSIELQRPVPEGVTANDMLMVLKTMQPLTIESGVTLVPQPNLQAKVAALAAATVHSRLGGTKVDLVVTPESSSAFADTFGRALAGYFGAELVTAGVLKSHDITLNMPDHVKDTKTGRDAMKALERWKKKLGSGRVPSLRSTFKPSMRDYLSGFMQASNDVAPWIGEGKRVLMVDDVVTSGSTYRDSKRALEELGFVVVAQVAAVKEQSS